MFTGQREDFALQDQDGFSDGHIRRHHNPQVRMV
jgi:hypothetical protein